MSGKAALRTCIALAACLSSTASLTQNFSPHLQTSGRGAYDQYRDVVLCSAVFEDEITAGNSEPRPEAEQGLFYAVNFALLLLENGEVVDESGSVLPSHVLPDDRHDAAAYWQEILAAAANDTQVAETARCLSLYGHEWE